MKLTACIAGLLVFSLPAVAAEQDCGLAKRYLALAQQRSSSSSTDETVALLQQSIDACPSYDAHQQLADILAESPERAARRDSARNFVAAYGLAPNDRARAHTGFSYAHLLDSDGDPQNANAVITNARALDPGDAEIAALADHIEAEVSKPTSAQLVRGLWDSMYMPIVFLNPASPGRPARNAPPAPVEDHEGPSDNIPINFATGSTVVGEETRANVEVLAHALASPELAGRTFLFVGHADARGSAAANLVLSKRRAAAIYESVVSIEPSLAGRVELTGRGATQPLDPGNDARAWRLNRRLQVLRK